MYVLTFTLLLGFTFMADIYLSITAYSEDGINAVAISVLDMLQLLMLIPNVISLGSWKVITTGTVFVLVLTPVTLIIGAIRYLMLYEDGDSFLFVVFTLAIFGLSLVYSVCLLTFARRTSKIMQQLGYYV